MAPIKSGLPLPAQSVPAPPPLPLACSGEKTCMSAVSVWRVAPCIRNLHGTGGWVKTGRQESQVGGWRQESQVGGWRQNVRNHITTQHPWRDRRHPWRDKK